MAEIIEPKFKKVCLSSTSIEYEIHYLIPRGIIWSNNSCAYDSIFTVLFSIWCGNKNLWHYKFQEIYNPFIRALTDGFNDVDNNRKTLETICSVRPEGSEKTMPNQKKILTLNVNNYKDKH